MLGGVENVRPTKISIYGDVLWLLTHSHTHLFHSGSGYMEGMCIYIRYGQYSLLGISLGPGQFWGGGNCVDRGCTVQLY